MQWKNTSANETVDDNSFVYLTVKAPNDASLDISNSDNLVMTVGNSRETDASANSFNNFTIQLNGGTQNASYVGAMNVAWI